MKVHQLIRPRTVALLVMVLILAAVTYGFAALNSMPAQSNAGDGAVTISGYTISNVVYDIYSDSDPADIDNINFDVTAQGGGSDPGSVYVKLDASSSTWVSCSFVALDEWTCPINGSVTTLDADELRVVAVD